MACDERSRRRPEFVEGARLRLADGQEWTLPGPLSDPSYDAILATVVDPEDDTERLRSELSLTIYLLSRNYDLAPDDFQEILLYHPEDPALAEMQQAIRAILMDHARLRVRASTGLTAGPHTAPGRRPAPRRACKPWAFWFHYEFLPRRAGAPRKSHPSEG